MAATLVPMTTAENATEMSITEARERFADMVNTVTYAGDHVHLTRRGRRVAIVAPPEAIAQARMEAVELAVLHMVSAMKRAEEHSRDMAAWTHDPRHVWKSLRDEVMSMLEQLQESAEEEADAIALAVSKSERESGARATPLADLRKELGL